MVAPANYGFWLEEINGSGANIIFLCVEKTTGTTKYLFLLRNAVPEQKFRAVVAFQDVDREVSSGTVGNQTTDWQDQTASVEETGGLKFKKAVIFF